MANNIPEKMQIAVLNKPFDIEIKEVNVPKLKPHEVLVKMMAVGVCGSDVHYYEHGKIGNFIVEEPLILGHECAGIVVDVGEEVTKFSVGDRVAVEPGVPCGKCEQCRNGQYNLCQDVEFLATPPVDGAFAQYLAHSEDFLYLIPDSLSYEQASLNEPFSVGIQACKRANVQPGSTVLIAGMGPVGLMAVVAAKAFGATRIIVTDLADIRLDEALKLGATDTINISKENPVDRIYELTNGKGVDYAFETAGHPSALQSAVQSLAVGGSLSIVGLPQQEDIALNIPFIGNRELNIYGVFRYANTYPMGIEILNNTNADLDSMFTDSYELKDTQEALERALRNKEGSLKVMVYPNGFLG